MLEMTVWGHAAAGSVAIVAGVVALVSNKGPGRHPKAGKVFAIFLGLLLLLILPSLVAHSNAFLFGLGWLAGHAATVGWRSLLRFRGTLDEAPQPFDYALNGLTAATSVALVGFGMWVFATRGNPIGLVCVGFGALGLVLVNGARQRWQRPPERKEWLAVHIGMMTGAFSAALTAFFAIQLSGHLGGFEWVLWVAPTVVMVIYGRREMARRGLSG